MRMRLAGLLMVPVVSAAVSTVGLYVAAPAGADDCETRNGALLCTDAQPSGTPIPGTPQATRTYPCIVGLTCAGTFESDLVTGGDN